MKGITNKTKSKRIKMKKKKITDNNLIIISIIYVFIILFIITFITIWEQKNKLGIYTPIEQQNISAKLNKILDNTLSYEKNKVHYYGDFKWNKKITNNNEVKNSYIFIINNDLNINFSFYYYDLNKDGHIEEKTEIISNNLQKLSNIMPKEPRNSWFTINNVVNCLKLLDKNINTINKNIIK